MMVHNLQLRRTMGEGNEPYIYESPILLLAKSIINNHILKARGITISIHCYDNWSPIIRFEMFKNVRK